MASGRLNLAPSGYSSHLTAVRGWEIDPANGQHLGASWNPAEEHDVLKQEINKSDR